MATILGTRTIDGILVINTNTNPRIGGTSAPQGSFCTASDGSGTFFKTGPSNNDWINTSISIGSTRTLFYSTDFETGALPAGWNQATASGGTAVFNQAAETGVIGLGLLQTTAVINSRAGLQYSNGFNFLLSFLDCIFTQQIFKIRWNGIPPNANITHAFGWLNTNAAVTPSNLGNALAIMYDPSNTSGFNPGLITNLFLLARSVYGGTGNTVVNLGVLPDNVNWRDYQIIYDNVLNEVRVYRDMVLLKTLTNLANVPGGLIKGAIPIGAGTALQPNIYLGSSAAVAPLAASGIRIDKHTTYKIYN